MDGWMDVSSMARGDLERCVEETRSDRPQLARLLTGLFPFCFVSLLLFFLWLQSISRWVARSVRPFFDGPGRAAFAIVLLFDTPSGRGKKKKKQMGEEGVG